MTIYDIIPFLPEVILLSFALITIGMAAFRQKTSVFSLSLFLQSACLLSLAFLWTHVPYTKYGFSDFLVFNAYTRFFKIIIIFAFMGIVAAISPYLEKEDLHQPEFFGFMAFAVVGCLLMVSSYHFISLFMAMELASFAMYLMVSHKQHILSTEAGLKYFILGALSTAFYLFGVSFVYGALGTFSFDAMFIHAKDYDLYVTLGFLFITMAFFFKMSLVPFHMWTPDVYQGSPTPVTLFLSVIPKISTLGIFIVLITNVFKQQDVSLLYIISILSMGVGSLTALFQKNIKRLMAYSTISHMGYISMGLLCDHFQSITAILTYIVIYAVTLVGLFSCLLGLKYYGKTIENNEDLKGLGTKAPLISAALLVFLFSLTGLPPLAGFFAKLTLFSAVLEKGHITLVVFAIVSSVISAGYYLKIIKLMYFEDKIDNHTFHALDISQARSTHMIMILASLFVMGYIFMSDLLTKEAMLATKILFSKMRV